METIKTIFCSLIIILIFSTSLQSGADLSGTLVFSDNIDVGSVYKWKVEKYTIAHEPRETPAALFNMTHGSEIEVEIVGDPTSFNTVELTAYQEMNDYFEMTVDGQFFNLSRSSVFMTYFKWYLIHPTVANGTQNFLEKLEIQNQRILGYDYFNYIEDGIYHEVKTLDDRVYQMQIEVETGLVLEYRRILDSGYDFVINLVNEAPSQEEEEGFFDNVAFPISGFFALFPVIIYLRRRSR